MSSKTEDKTEGRFFVLDETQRRDRGTVLCLGRNTGQDGEPSLVPLKTNKCSNFLLTKQNVRFILAIKKHLFGYLSV